MSFGAVSDNTSKVWNNSEFLSKSANFKFFLDDGGISLSDGISQEFVVSVEFLNVDTSVLVFIMDLIVFEFPLLKKDGLLSPLLVLNDFNSQSFICVSISSIGV